jgi:hypothetical protein
MHSELELNEEHHNGNNRTYTAPDKQKILIPLTEYLLLLAKSHIQPAFAV